MKFRINNLVLFYESDFQTLYIVFPGLRNIFLSAHTPNRFMKYGISIAENRIGFADIFSQVISFWFIAIFRKANAYILIPIQDLTIKLLIIH